jgi:hypothetical protein
MLRFLCLPEKKNMNIPELWFNSVTVRPFILSATANGTPYISDEVGVQESHIKHPGQRLGPNSLSQGQTNG